jgi:predicted HicB family RNase H-like nuclease
MGPVWNLRVRLPVRLRGIVYRALGTGQSVNQWLEQQVRSGLEAHTRYSDHLKDGD